MKHKSFVCIASVLMFISIVFQTNAQDFVTKRTASKKALKAYNEGDILNSRRDYTKAIEAFSKALKYEPNFVDALLLRADSYYALQQLANAEQDFEKLLEVAPEYNLRVYYVVGVVERKQEKYAEAAAHFEKYLSYNPRSESLKKKATRLMKSCQFATEAVANPVPFNPQNLGENINSRFPEYLPTISADRQTFLFTRRLGHQEDFFISRMQPDGTWSPARNLGAPINTLENEGAETISANGKFLVYTVCNRQEDYGSCDLYYSELKKNGWSTPRNMGPTINTPALERQPSLSADGNTLYFVSDRKGGKGGKDIWVSKRQSNGQFSKPENLNINSNGNDECPFIHADGETFYFTSTAYVGMGGADLFMSKKQANGTWSDPKNLGYPINSQGNEGSLIIDLDGKTTYISSDKEGGFGAVDLYSFEMPEQFRPKPVTYVKGIIYSAESKNTLSANVEIADINENKMIQTLETTREGDFLICLPVGVDYRLAVEKEGFLFHSENFALKEATSIDEPYELKIYLQSIKATVQTTDEPAPVYRPTILKNVFFESGSANLSSNSATELQALVDLLNKNPEMNIQINGHTDNVGNETDNLKLSKDRAQSVVNHLIKAGIAVNRLKSEGFGESRPIDTNDTKLGRKNNRRTEFIIIK